MKDSENAVITSVSISPALRDELKKQAKERGFTQTAAIREAIAAWLGRPELAEMREQGRPPASGGAK